MIAEIRAFRKGRTLGSGVSIKELVGDGRRMTVSIRVPWLIYCAGVHCPGAKSGRFMVAASGRRL